MRGKVKWFSVEKEFGFITCDEGSDHFFHATETSCRSPLREGDRVEFESVKGSGGKVKAKAVKLLRRAPAEKKNEARVHSFVVPPSIVRPKGQKRPSAAEKSSSNKKQQREFYGRATETVQEVAFSKGASVGQALGSALGPVGEFFGHLIGEAWSRSRGESSGPVSVEVDLPKSTCMRCGGRGLFTKRQNDRVGFQCEGCYRFWTEHR